MATVRRRRALALLLVAGVVALSVGAVLVSGGSSPGQALVGAILAGLFALVVVPLAVIARQVGSSADDPIALERRIGTAAGRSPGELDALAEWDERSGRLEEVPDEE